MPSHTPTLVNSGAPSINPSKYPSESPSTTLHSKPSVSPTHSASKQCPSETFNGETITKVILGRCYKIEFFTGGVIKIDPHSSTCVGAYFGPSNFARFDKFSGSDVLYSVGDLGWSGAIHIVHSPGSSLDVIGKVTGEKTFSVLLSVPHC
jgi:hypothetical protein